MQTTEYLQELTEAEKEKIISDSLPYIKYTAYRLAKRLPPQLSVEDLISVGVTGLLDALQRYTEGRVKISTFVEYRIKGAMLDELRAHDWLPRSMKDKITRVRKAHAKLEQELGRMPNDDEIARAIGIGLEEYYKIVQNADNAIVFRFEDFNQRSSDGGDLDVTESIPDPSGKTPLQLCEDSDVKAVLARQIEGLPEKEKLVLSLYYWDELTMKEVGKVLNITEGRVCQIHNQAVIRLKSQLHPHFPR
jgi:RNA polymerase sigma factor for flagellar operon FliA